MPRVAPSPTHRFPRAGLLLALLCLSAPAFSGPIAFDTYLQFSFGEAGVPAAGCDPADPAGAFCLPSSGTATEFLDAPGWTFTASAEGATLTVLDAFLSGDRFEVFDFGTSLGFTSAPVGGGDCGDDPVVCLADLTMSRGVFSLAAGLHSISLVPSLVPDFGGTGYLRLTAGGGPTAVPEPGTLVLLATGLAVLAVFRTRRWRAAGPRGQRAP